MPLRYWALLLFLGAVWGGSFMFNAILIREIDPLWVSAGRVIIGATICWVYFFATKRELPDDPIIYAQLLLLGVINYAIPFALFPYAEEHVPSGIVGVINGLTPMSTVIVSQMWPGGEKATFNKVLGVLVGFGGAVLLASPSFAQGGTAEIPALLAALAATFCYAFSLNFARRFPQHRLGQRRNPVAERCRHRLDAIRACHGGHAGHHPARNLGGPVRHRHPVDQLLDAAALLAAATHRRDQCGAQHLHHTDLGAAAWLFHPEREP